MIVTKAPTIALVGNPNTGKTTLFNALAGLRQRVGNYPGVTVEIKKGRFTFQGQSFEVIDLPGTYSLAPRSPDEMVAVDLILGQTPGESKPDAVVTIVDAANLERNLYLTTQVLELGVPVVVALNMMDVAEGHGVNIDVAQLEQNLGVPVVPLQAHKGKGIEALKHALVRAVVAPALKAGPAFPDAFEREVEQLQGELPQHPPYLVRRLILDVGGHTERRIKDQHGDQFELKVHGARQRLADAGCSVPGVEARTRYAWIRQATTGCVRKPAHRLTTGTDRLDRILTHKVWGTLIFLALMFVVFVSIFYLATPFMDLIQAGQAAVAGWTKDLMEPGPLLSLLADGVIGGVGGVLVFLPQIMILFAFIAVLEDCGYMARAAFLMDRLMARCGLNGKSFIPLLSSVACAVPGIMAARVIENRRDRLATILVAPLMSCSARLPVYLLLIGAFLSPEHGFAWWVPGMTLFAMYAVGLVAAPLMALLLKSTLLRGETPAFVMEMPLYKRPSLKLVLHRAWDAGRMFIRRAGTIILASMIVVWSLLYFPATDPGGNSYDAAIAELEDSIQEERDEKKKLDQRMAPLVEKEKKKKKLTTAEKSELEKAQAELAPLKEKLDPVEEKINDLQSEWRGQSLLGRTGKVVEPMVRPLGWDWRIGMAALASFPAREVMVGTLGLIFRQGEGDAGDEEYRDALGGTLREITWDDDPTRKVFSVPVALSVMVFFALCCQCASTLAVIKRETNGWAWPAFTFVYMTALAYAGALIVYQVGSLLI